ncbi:MAG: PIG-L family deacetylase [Acidobacteria bacterium]|nr:PIG-L family deacetylase [Acidobacteriota bacterium]
MTILVIAAHPDDEVLGCGGTIARYAAEGHDVHIAILGEGITSRHTQRGDAQAGDLQKLQVDARAAAAALGARPVSFGGLPDNRFDQVALLDVVKQVETWVGKLRPDAIYTHHPGDLNIDHGIAFRAVLTATRPGASAVIVPDVYAFEVPSSTEWAFQRIEPAFRPSVFVDIAIGLEKKIAAMQCYENERRETPHPRSPEMLRATAARWGSVAGMAAAEPFELIRSLRRR